MDTYSPRLTFVFHRLEEPVDSYPLTFDSFPSVTSSWLVVLPCIPYSFGLAEQPVAVPVVVLAAAVAVVGPAVVAAAAFVVILD